MSAGALPAAGTEEAVADRMVDAIKEALAGDPQHFDEMAQAYAEMPGLLAVVAMTAASALFDVVSKQRTRLKALEERPSMQYRGVHSTTEAYQVGDATTAHGSLWICRSAVGASATPGEGSTCWTLAAKRGRDFRPRERETR